MHFYRDRKSSEPLSNKIKVLEASRLLQFKNLEKEEFTKNASMISQTTKNTDIQQNKGSKTTDKRNIRFVRNQHKNAQLSKHSQKHDSLEKRFSQITQITIEKRIIVKYVPIHSIIKQRLIKGQNILTYSLLPASVYEYDHCSEEERVDLVTIKRKFNAIFNMVLILIGAMLLNWVMNPSKKF